MFEVGEVRKSVSFHYSAEGLSGDTILITARNPDTDEEFEPKKEVPKDGSFALAFPEGYTGRVVIAIHGSEGGDQTDEVQIP